MRKLLAILILVISIFSVACGGDSTYNDAEKIIKNKLIKPNTYKLEKYEYAPDKSLIKIKFQADNEYGVKTTQYAYLGINKNGKVLDGFLHFGTNEWETYETLIKNGKVTK